MRGGRRSHRVSGGGRLWPEVPPGEQWKQVDAHESRPPAGPVPARLRREWALTPIPGRSRLCSAASRWAASSCRSRPRRGPPSGCGRWRHRRGRRARHRRAAAAPFRNGHQRRGDRRAGSPCVAGVRWWCSGTRQPVRRTWCGPVRHPKVAPIADRCSTGDARRQRCRPGSAPASPPSPFGLPGPRPSSAPAISSVCPRSVDESRLRPSTARIRKPAATRAAPGLVARVTAPFGADPDVTST